MSNKTYDHLDNGWASIDDAINQYAKRSREHMTEAEDDIFELTFQNAMALRAVIQELRELKEQRNNKTSA